MVAKGGAACSHGSCAWAAQSSSGRLQQVGPAGACAARGASAAQPRAVVAALERGLANGRVAGGVVGLRAVPPWQRVAWRRSAQRGRRGWRGAVRPAPPPALVTGLRSPGVFNV
eukprot:10128100-Lingulodinium_polyedra.AAC.1